jgi:hypothetical protein
VTRRCWPLLAALVTSAVVAAPIIAQELGAGGWGLTGMPNPVPGPLGVAGDIELTGTLRWTTDGEVRVGTGDDLTFRSGATGTGYWLQWAGATANVSMGAADQLTIGDGRTGNDLETEIELRATNAAGAARTSSLTARDTAAGTAELWLQQRAYLQGDVGVAGESLLEADASLTAAATHAVELSGRPSAALGAGEHTSVLRLDSWGGHATDNATAARYGLRVGTPDDGGGEEVTVGLVDGPHRIRMVNSSGAGEDLYLDVALEIGATAPGRLLLTGSDGAAGRQTWAVWDRAATPAFALAGGLRPTRRWCVGPEEMRGHTGAGLANTSDWPSRAIRDLAAGGDVATWQVRTDALLGYLDVSAASIVSISWTGATAPGAGNDTVRWRGQWKAVADNGDLSAALSAPADVDDDLSAALQDERVTLITIPAATLVMGQRMLVYITRDGGATDDYAHTASLLGSCFEYTSLQ